MAGLYFGRKGAFTLLEVIFISVILCGSLFILIQTFSPGLESKQKVEKLSLMIILAQRFMEQIRTEGYDSLAKKYPGNESGSGEGESKDAPGFRWRVNWWETGVPNLRKVRIKIWGEIEEKGFSPELEVITYLARR